jgi:L-asparaginase II
MTAPAELVRVVRNGLVESVHTGDVAVCDVDGTLRAFAGDADRMLFGRSCEKPLQGAVSFSAMGEPNLPDDEIAVMCASHSGEPVHIATVRRLLRRGPVPVAALRTPRDRATKGARSRIWDGCSGNHAGLLVAAARQGWDLDGYRSPNHPVQRRVLRAVTAATDMKDPRIGVDGCGIPVHGVPLRAMATMFARFGTPDRLGRLAPAADRVVRGMLAAPHMVGGTRRLDTDVMTVGAGQLIAKEGAEGLVCATSLSQGLGIALKVTDGNWRRLAPAFIEVLRELDVLPARASESLRHHEELPVLGGEQPQGAVEAVIRLRRPRSGASRG